MKHHLYVVLSSLLLLVGCKTVNIPASNAFYINDMANALLSSTKYYIYANSKALHDVDSQNQTFKDSKISGAQVVVATYNGPLNSLNSTTIFNEWKIGENDMGVFLLLYFADNPADEYLPTYLGMTWEIGAKMAGFISMFRLNEIFSETWDDPLLENVLKTDYDYRLMTFYSGILNEIYTKVYRYAPLAQNELLADYKLHQYDSFYNFLPKGNAPRVVFHWSFYVLLSFAAITLFGVSGLVVSFRTQSKSAGGGGKSRGYKYTR